MRRITATLLTGVLALVAFVVPVATLPVAAAEPVAPELVTLEVADVDPKAAADPTAILPPVHEHVGEETVETLHELGIEGSQQLMQSVENPVVEPLESVQDDDLAALSALERTQRFLIAGVTWDAAASENVLEVVVRVLEEGNWGQWQDLSLIAPEDVMDRAGTAPLITGGADGIQARIRTESGRVPSGLQIELIDPGASPADRHAAAGAAPAGSAHAATGYEIKPKVITRKQWGADESLATPWPQPNQSAELKAMYVHHEACDDKATSCNNYKEEDAPAKVRGIYAYHALSMKWPDIGYQFLVDRFGNLYEGRQGAINTLPIGAQAGGFNTGTIGVSAIGNFVKTEPSAAIVTSISKLFAWKAHQYGLDPNGTTTLVTGTSSKSTTKTDKGQSVKVPVILGHRNTNATACPGERLYAKLPSIRTKTQKRLNSAIASYGKVQPSFSAAAAPKAPTLVKPAATGAPVRLSDSITLKWKKVPNATAYKVMTRTAKHGKEFGPWKTLSPNSKKLKQKIKIPNGASVLVGVRAIGPDGKTSALAKFPRITRPVSSSTLLKSKAPKKWSKVRSSKYFRDFAYSTNAKGATLKVKKAKDVRIIQVAANRDSASGRIAIYAGKERIKVVNLKSAKTKRLSRITVKLPKKFSGTITAKTLDAKRVRVSAITTAR